MAATIEPTEAGAIGAGRARVADGVAGGATPPGDAPGLAARDAALLERLRAVARANGGATIAYRDLEHPDAPPRDALERRFGGWAAAARLAGLTPVSHWRAYSDEECFANLAALMRHYGRLPRLRDCDRPPSRVGSSVYERRAGSWRAALAAFVRFCGLDRATAAGIARLADGDAPPRAAVRAPRPRPADPAQGPRAVPKGMRFQVFQRDRFRCQACGNSPATDPACTLHADHIVPYARGGRTEPGNLRTLCAACNIGRGTRPVAEEPAPQRRGEDRRGW